MRPTLTLCLALLAAAPVLQAAEPAATVPASQPVARITGAELQARVDQKDAGLVVLDVRTPAEFAAGHVPGARNIPHDQVAARLDELAASRDQTVVLYCRTGRRSGLAAEVLRSAGFGRLLQLEGDYPGWEAARRPVERASGPAAPPSN